MSKLKLWLRINQLWKQVLTVIDTPWYLPITSVLAAVDAFVLVVPTDFFLVSGVLAQPRRWFRITISITTGSSLGAMAVAGVIQYLGGEGFVDWVRGFSNPETWAQIEQAVDQYGAVALAFVAFGPFPLPPGAIAAGLVGIPLPVVFVWVWIGRVVKYLGFAQIALRAPRLLRRIFPEQVKPTVRGIFD